ncbi:hypothetical protein M569_05531, partial [Genlisea aurea]
EPKSNNIIWSPFSWFAMLAAELHWSFVFGVVIVYGINQGLGGAFWGVSSKYYMKDVQKVQPSEAQVYSGITNIPWIVKPVWGIFTDLVPIFGYQRRPYFILAGILGIIPMIFLSQYKDLPIVLALLFMTAGNASVAIADVTVDACVAQNSGTHPFLAADMQSMCALSSSIGSLLGFSISGILVHWIGSQGVFGLLTIPAGLVLLVGLTLKENQTSTLAYEQVSRKLITAAKAMWKTLKIPEVWKPCIYMYFSLSLSINISEGMFYWVTDSSDGPQFSQETIGYILAVGSVGSLLGAILYQNALKNYPFRDILFWAQILSFASGMLDLVLVLRLNLKLGIPDRLFVVADVSVSQMISRLMWMPLLVLSSKLCPPGIEGTFFALLMSIDNAGTMTASWSGGLLLHVLSVTRTRFGRLWVGVLIRNVMRIAPLFLLFLVPRTDPNAALLPDSVMNPNGMMMMMMVGSSDDDDEEAQEFVNVELISLL